MSKRKNGFTLIELLAVIIILGVLMLIAIPSVTEYISNSRKKVYLSTASQYIGATTLKINNLDLPIKDLDTTYYVPVSYINLEKGGRSPYGDWENAYVVVTFDGTKYAYYWTSLDEGGNAVLLTYGNSLTNNSISTSVESLDLTVGVGGRSKIVIFNEDGSVFETTPATSTIANGGSLSGGSTIATTNLSCFEYDIYDEETLIDWFGSVEEAEDYYGIDASLILDKIYISGYNGYQSDGITKCPTAVIIPNQIEGKSVVTIDYYAFKYYDGSGGGGVGANSIGESGVITRLSNTAEYMFMNSENLTSIVLPNSLIIIDVGAFDGNQLTNVTIPNTVEFIGDVAFADNQLTSVTIPNTVKYIGDEAFARNQLTNVAIPNTVEYIGTYAFCDNQLTNVTIPNTVEYIVYGAFAGNQLTNVTIPNSVTTIGGCAFCDNQLTNVTIPNTVELIGDGAFAGNQLTSVTIPNSVTSIGENAFSQNQLTTVNMSEGVIEIGPYSFSDNSLSTVTLPFSVEFYCGNAFDLSVTINKLNPLSEEMNCNPN